MSKLIVAGKNKLEGELTIQGSKNSCLPMLAACLVIRQEVILNNCPNISDVREMLSVLKYLGCDVRFNNNRLIVNSENIINRELPVECNRLRGSIVCAGAMLSVFGEVTMPYPGGCNIGSRPIDFHINGLSALGVSVEQEEGVLKGKVVKNRLNGYYAFPKPSLGALENLILRTLSINGTCIFDNCTLEPEIEDFCDFLNKAGAKIIGAGTKRIIVEGGHKLSSIEYTVPGDRIVAGTYLCATAITRGSLCCKGVAPKRLEKLNFYLRKNGCHLFTDYQTNEIIEVAGQNPGGDSVIITGPYPEFATDLQPQMMAFSCYSKGSTVIKDMIYPARYAVATELIKMGANITLLEDMAIVKGGAPMYGAVLKAKDLRGGAALVIAALGSEGVSHIEDCEYIARGYEDIVGDLGALGADIKWNVGDEENQLT